MSSGPRVSCALPINSARRRGNTTSSPARKLDPASQNQILMGQHTARKAYFSLLTLRFGHQPWPARCQRTVARFMLAQTGAWEVFVGSVLGLIELEWAP